MKFPARRVRRLDQATLRQAESPARRCGIPSLTGEYVTAPDLRFCAFTVAATALLSACGDLFSSTPGPVAVSRSDDTVIIVDQTGKRWDVGHGRTYGLSPSKYQFGL
ncbi:MAG: hypothetical protein HOC05_17350, partial [Gemmatimonadetes bacterium]|nr:hypothetical protein [Gemmatimonadota bacterium]